TCSPWSPRSGRRRARATRWPRCCASRRGSCARRSPGAWCTGRTGRRRTPICSSSTSSTRTTPPSTCIARPRTWPPTASVARRKGSPKAPPRWRSTGRSRTRPASVSLTLVPHAAETADRLHVWVGLADVSPAPALTWKLDGADVTPTTLRPLAPALTGALAAAAATTVYTGFFELRGLPTGQSMRLEVAAGTERVERQVTTLPAQVPDGPQDHLNVLLLSCFHQLEDKTGTAGNVLSQMKVRPHLTLFGGDQVYLDLPTLANFQDKLEWLGNKFQNDYLTNWFGDRRTSRDPREIAPGYPQVLALAPGVFMPDDHEYWNNYPFGATVIQNSWTEEGRDRWKLAADALYRAFQQNAAPGLGPSRVLEIAPLSILMLDTRSQRSMTSRTKDHDLLGLSGRQALEGWVNGLVARAQDAQPWFGMLVTGQSFFSPPAGAVTGAIADYEYPDYQADYAFMLKQVERVTTAGLPVILATGDVHWGRMLRADDLSRPGAAVFEVVSSP